MVVALLSKYILFMSILRYGVVKMLTLLKLHTGIAALYQD